MIKRFLILIFLIFKAQSADNIQNFIFKTNIDNLDSAKLILLFKKNKTVRKFYISNKSNLNLNIPLDKKNFDYLGIKLSINTIEFKSYQSELFINIENLKEHDYLLAEISKFFDVLEMKFNC